MNGLAFAVLAVASVLVAVAVAPPASVTVLGQDVTIGAVSPTSSSASWSGPGVAELFGEGPISTIQQFEGPIRPRIVWQRFNRDAAAGAFIQTTSGDGRPSLVLNTDEIGEALARGWLEFLVRLVLLSGVIGSMAYLVGSTALGVMRGRRWRLQHAEHPVRPILVSGGASMLVALAAAGLTVLSARDQLAGISTLADLTGTAPLVAPPAAVGPPRAGIEVAVIGDSTAAGVGNAPLPRPTDADIACARSADAYANVLGAATGWGVENLACASATISEGLLGPQPRRPVSPPAQVGVLKSITSLRAVIVSAGANDIGWSDFLQYCYGLSRCDDQATEQLILSRLDTFRLQYAQLLQQLSALPSRPAVIVVGYYDPFGDSFDCPALRDPDAPDVVPDGYGFAPAQPYRAQPDQAEQDQAEQDQAEQDRAEQDRAEQDRAQALMVQQKIEPLRSVLAQLNAVLEQGAQAFGFTSVVPNFRGHALCSAQPWVQGMSDPYPFHPRAAGELAIAAALLPRLIPLVPIS